MASGLRPNVLKMTPYTPGKPIDEVKRELGLTEVVKLASNENPLGPSPKAVEAVRAAAAQMHLYPDASGYELKVAVAEKFGVTTDQVMIGNGSDELIHLLGLIYLEPGDNVVIGAPSFVRYDAAAHLSDVELRAIPLDQEWKHDLAAMAEACDEKTKLIFLANPHNPTGTVLTHSEISKFLNQIPANAVLVLDEAYYEYSEGLADRLDSVSLLKSGRKVVVLRTFSKAFGLAGIRVGYGLASAEIVDATNRAREPFNVNSLAQAAAIAALNDSQHLANSFQVNTQGLNRVAEFMSARGYGVVPSRANFICVDVASSGKTGQELFDLLLREGVIIRSGGPLGMPSHIRVSIGTPAEMDEFFAAFDRVMG
ncbi:MAG: histidinol-phosphate transaminase [Fimbriimonadaceae bacterium]|nr:histidinol-phosphate transaminase [Fimbriimonadaceae bacterium]